MDLSMLKECTEILGVRSFETRWTRHVILLLALFTGWWLALPTGAIGAPDERFINIKQTVLDRHYKNLFIDEKFVYFTDWHEKWGTLLVVAHNGRKVQQFRLGDVLVDQLKRGGDAIYLVAREPTWIGKEPTINYWERPSFIFKCRFEEPCKMLRGGDFGVKAIAPYRGGVIASEYEWEDFRFVEGLKAPRRTRLVHLYDSKTEEVTSNIPGAVWGLDMSQDGALFAYFGWVDAYKTLNFTTRSKYTSFIHKRENYKYRFGTYRFEDWKFKLHSHTKLFNIHNPKEIPLPENYPEKEFIVCEDFESNQKYMICIDKFTDGNKSKEFHLPGYRIIYWKYGNQRANVRLDGIASWPSLIGSAIYFISDDGDIEKIDTGELD